jgi:hypothetical protein
MKPLPSPISRAPPRGLKKTCGRIGCRIGHPRRTVSAVPLPLVQGGNCTRMDARTPINTVRFRGGVVLCPTVER